MKNGHILEAMTDIDSAYIVSAQQKLGYSLEKQAAAIPRRRTFRRTLALATAAIVIMAAVLTSAMAFSPEFRKVVWEMIEILFPPRDIIVAPEGFSEAVPHSAQGKEPEEDAPGFAIYVDNDRYSMMEENGIFYIRPAKAEVSREDVRKDNAGLLEGLSPEEHEAVIDRRMADLEAFYASLPVCEIEIREIADIAPVAVAEAIKTQAAESWETISEINRSAQPSGLYLTVSGGSSWDSPQEEHYFLANGQQGTFHIILRYYLEAAEGHGVRFHAMLDTFSLVTPQDAAQYDVS